MRMRLQQRGRDCACRLLMNRKALRFQCTSISRACSTEVYSSRS